VLEHRPPALGWWHLVLAWPGERVAVVGLWHVVVRGQCYAALREIGRPRRDRRVRRVRGTDRRAYDRVVAITRSGTTTEVLDLLEHVDGPSVAITADAGTPVAEVAAHVIALPFADERSVVADPVRDDDTHPAAGPPRRGPDPGHRRRANRRRR